MSADWPEVCLTDIYEVRSGLSKPAAAFGSGYPFLTFKEVFNNFFLPDCLTQLVQSTDSERALGGIKRGDVFLTRTSETLDELGMSSVALKDYPNSTFNGFTKRLRPRVDSQCNTYPEYIGYYLRSQPFRRDVLALSSMSTRASLNNEMIGRLRVVLPPLETQKVIAKALKCLDDKIVVNRRINQTLEAMAQAIFKSWFVDFDPVKAKIAAIAEDRDPLRAAMSAISGKSDAELRALPPERYEQLAATAALFPDDMEGSELDKIPRGWQVQRVGNVLELVYGKALKSTDRQEGSVPVYGSGGITGYHNTPLVQHGSIIVGRKGTVGSLYWEDEPFFPIDTTYYVRPLAAPLTFCYYAMQTLGLKKMNTDAVVPGLNRENVYRLELVLPGAPALQKFDSYVSTLREAIRANSESNKALTNLRDSLLPKLLSGELSVEALAEQAGIA